MTPLAKTKPVRLAAATPSQHGPGAFKPETVGQRAFNPCARGSTPPGFSIAPNLHD
jgi:hypothetical protein